MSVTIKELRENPLALRKLNPHSSTADHENSIKDSYQEKECEELGELIEQHPICSPRIRRGD
jgi:hypothetical protein